MKTIEYFKLQAKNLHKDFKTQKPYFDSSLGDNLFEYTPKFFDVDALVTDFEIHENHFTLMNAQHIIARLGGFKKWTVLLQANPEELELSKLLFDSMHKISIEEWNIYISVEQDEKGFLFDDESKLDIFKAVFADVNGHQSGGYDYRLAKIEKPSIENQKIKPMEKKSTIQINTLPLAGKDRKEFIEVANRIFEDILKSIEHAYPELVRKLWNPEQYIEQVIKPDMLPIDRDYALSLVEGFLVHKVIDLATEVDKEGIKII
jgi:hypothetical protein